MNYMSLVDEYEKECVVDKGEKVSREWRAVREGFAAWLDKRAAQHRVQSDGDDIQALGRQARMIADQQAGNRSGLRPRR